MILPLLECFASSLSLGHHKTTGCTKQESNKKDELLLTLSFVVASQSPDTTGRTQQAKQDKPLSTLSTPWLSVPDNKREEFEMMQGLFSTASCLTSWIHTTHDACDWPGDRSVGGLTSRLRGLLVPKKSTQSTTRAAAAATTAEKAARHLRALGNRTKSSISGRRRRQRRPR